MTVVDRMDNLEVGVGSVAFWGLGQVGVAIIGPTGVLYVDPYLTGSDGAGGRFLETFLPLSRPTRLPTPTRCS